MNVLIVDPTLYGIWVPLPSYTIILKFTGFTLQSLYGEKASEIGFEVDFE